jgi:AcrR family transcriptional regulator/acyl-CoA thioesterase FadM
MSRTAVPRQDTRRELLEATRRVVARVGFASATVGEITREAGASLGLLHYHFGSKDEVVAEAFAEFAREDLAELEDISRRHDDPAERLAAFLDLAGWADTASWSLWIDAWGEAVHAEALRDTLGRFALGWRAVLAEVIADGVRLGRWSCADPEETAARLIAATDGIGVHATLHDIPPERATAWARRLVELELAIALPPAPSPPPPPAARPSELRIAIRARDLDAHGRVHPEVVAGYLAEARGAWLAERLEDTSTVALARLEIDWPRPLERGDGPLLVRCGVAAAGRGGVRTRETIETAAGAPAVRAGALLVGAAAPGLSQSDLRALQR